VEDYRRLLLAKKQEVLSALELSCDTLSRTSRVGEEDQAQLSHDEFISLHLNTLDYSQLRLVEEALDRLDSGDFGFCLECEERISAKRLAVVPWARYCIACQDRMSQLPEQEFLASPRHREGHYLLP